MTTLVVNRALRTLVVNRVGNATVVSTGSGAPPAASISIVDAGGLITGTTVEAALQEATYRTMIHGGLPAAAIAQTVPRNSTLANAAVLSSGRETLSLVWLNAGQIVTSISYVCGATPLAGGVNQWFTLRSSARVLLKITGDDLAVAWAGNATKTLTLSGGTYTVPTSGLYYVGIMVNAGTVPTLISTTGTNALAATGIAPIVVGNDGTNLGLTTPATAPGTSAALSASSSNPYAYLS